MSSQDLQKVKIKVAELDRRRGKRGSELHEPEALLKLVVAYTWLGVVNEQNLYVWAIFPPKER